LIKDSCATEQSLEGLAETRFSFGRHKGKTFQEVLRCDPDYNERWNINPEELAQYFQYYVFLHAKAKEQMPAGLATTHFTFGKHKGKPFEEVVKCDPGYHRRYNINPQKLAQYFKYFEYEQAK
jgi:broad specificity phosphatase PhoE